MWTVFAEAGPYGPHVHASGPRSWHEVRIWVARSGLWPSRSRLSLALRVATDLPGMLHLRTSNTRMAAGHVAPRARRMR
jgi:hypothetical protein